MGMRKVLLIGTSMLTGDPGPVESPRLKRAGPGGESGGGHSFQLIEVLKLNPGLRLGLTLPGLLALLLVCEPLLLPPQLLLH